MEQMARAGYGQVPLEPLRTDAEVAAGFDANGCLRHDWVGSSCCNAALGPGVREGDLCCYNSCEGVCCGRALVVEGRSVVARAASRSDWLAAALQLAADTDTAALSEPERAALGSLWLGDALLEHASIASFARFALQLLATGAPAHLVAGAQAAGLDEVRHAELAFAIASRFAGEPLGPGPLVQVGHELSLDLMQVMVATIHEGCVGETLSALVALERARVAGDSSIRAALEAIAADEARHAELAFRCVAWALQQGGAAFEAAARLAFEKALGRTFDAAPSSAVSEPVLHHYGRLSAREEQALMAQGAEQVLWPAVRALFERSRVPVVSDDARA